VSVKRIVTFQVLLMKELVHDGPEVTAVDDLLDEPPDDHLVPLKLVRHAGQRRDGASRVLILHFVSS
jgi:hypothetical protein